MLVLQYRISILENESICCQRKFRQIPASILQACCAAKVGTCPSTILSPEASPLVLLGLQLEDQVPDAKTVWLLRQRLKSAGQVTTLFADLPAQLEVSSREK